MKQKTIDLYSYAELIDLHKQGKVSERAFNRATEWLQEGQTTEGWWEYVYDLWKSALAQIGFENADISFSGFWSQGDGASFTADIDVEKLARFLSDTIKPEDCIDDEDYRPWLVHKLGGTVTDHRYAWLTDIGLYGKVERTSYQYSHEHTCSVSIEYREPREHSALEAVIDEFERDAEILRYDICKAIYSALEAEYEYLTSEEVLLEMAEANDYTFRINGVAE